MTTQIRSQRRKPRQEETAPTRRLFTVDEYCRMAEVGILAPDERVELLAGEIFQMAAMGSRHAAKIRQFGSWFDVQLVNRAMISVQCPVQLGPQAATEPDVAILKHRADFYATAHPGSQDVLLLIEVADTSIGFDRDKKLPLYAAAGIPEVWIVDLNQRRVLIYRGPQNGAYSQQSIATRGGTLSPLAFPDLQLAVEDVLG